MSKHSGVAAIIGGLVLLAACDNSGKELLPQPNPDYPGVIEIGQLSVMSADDVGAIDPDWCANQDDPGCYFGQISSTDNVTKGGATFTFKGTGGRVCVMVDVETVSWNHYIGAGATASDWSVADYPGDDGDMDMFGGLSAYYTGSPGIEIGDFTGLYTDSLGRELEIDYVECYNSSVYTGGEAHAGRGAPEYCTINTAGREDIEFTIVLETFSVPRDDGLLSFMTAVVDSGCNSFNTSIPSSIGPTDDSAIELSGVSECLVTGESIAADGSVDPCSIATEYAYCANTTNAGAGALVGFCCLNPGVCAEDLADGACDDVDETEFCATWPGLCNCADG